MSPDQVLTDGFLPWLQARTKGPGAPLDPWGTSLRNTKRTVPWMTAVRAGEDIPQDTDRARDQAVSDMRSLAGLVSGVRSNDDVTLTPVGTAVLQVWEHEGLTGDSEGEEIARCIHLIRQVFVKQDWYVTGPTSTRWMASWYREVYERWRRLRRLQEPEYWWQSVEHAQLPCYLDWTDASGYNPWSVFVTTTGGDLGAIDEWDAWAASSEPEASDLKALLGRVRGSHRVGGSKTFRQALECIYLGEFDPISLAEALNRWDVPA